MNTEEIANIFNLPPELPTEELFEPLISTESLLIERIISTGQTTPTGEWYDQDQDEWVILLQGQATLAYLDASSVKLKAGDYLFIKAHQKHRVEYTSAEPPCIWLAVHGNLQQKQN
ncbi:MULTISPECIES: cupin domain-containing protein [unclassified Moorena]|uniref:cupin domain-containing protein n=1 Tax=unclassified Moorena TaxID=2683338 RepID=UPI0013FF911F|nr:MULTISPECIES: cupin domain-containing protein [unclassified Moorena]NEO11678.1 cupin domain-containing protein [Moorena sp. SIO3E8]NEP99404.1 cupin domain-containing protein [Moorena sp. SIO3F7]